MTPLEQLPIPLLEWYGEHARKLPWRDDPTAYHVWVSEIMLQQTRVAAVLDYYRRFMEAAPTISDLAQMPEEQLMKLWQGLGYDEAIARFPETERIRKACLGKLRYDGGESYGDVMERVRAFADEVLAENEGKTVVLASHGGTIRALFSSWLGYGPMEMAQVPIVPNASVSVVCIDGDRVTFELRDYTDHLAHVTVTDIE